MNAYAYGRALHKIQTIRGIRFPAPQSLEGVIVIRSNHALPQPRPRTVRSAPVSPVWITKTSEIVH